MALLDEYRPRYALVAARAGLGAEFDAAGELEIVERLPGTGMSEFYGVSGQKLDSDLEPMTEAECERRIAILRACWATFDDVAARVSPDLRPGPRGGGRDRDRIIRHTNGAELDEHAKKVGIVDAARRPRRPGPDRGPPGRLCRRDPRPLRPRGHRSELDAPVPDPPLHLALPRPRLGDGGPRPHGRALTSGPVQQEIFRTNRSSAGRDEPRRGVHGVEARSASPLRQASRGWRHRPAPHRRRRSPFPAPTDLGPVSCYCSTGRWIGSARGRSHPSRAHRVELTGVTTLGTEARLGAAGAKSMCIALSNSCGYERRCGEAHPHEARSDSGLSHARDSPPAGACARRG